MAEDTANTVTEDTSSEPSLLDQIMQNPELVAQLKDKLAPEAPEMENDKVKENIQKAYQQRDEMAKEIEELRSAKRDAELRALEEAGKKEEADKMRMEELKNQLAQAQAQVTGLTRDSALKGALAGMEFRSDKAAEIAYKDIVGNLIQDANGGWVSPTGQSIQDYVQFYASDESNSFMFKAKQSSGSSAMAAATNATTAPVKGEIDPRKMSALEFAQAIQEGKVDDGKKWF